MAPTAAKSEKDGRTSKSSRVPPFADYSDVVTDEHIARIKTLIPDSEHEGGTVIHGPAW